MMKSIISMLFVLAIALLVSSPVQAGYANGMNQYAAYHVMHGGVDPSGMISLSTVRHQDVGAGMSLSYLEQGNNAVDLLDTVEFRGRDDNGREIKDLDSGITMDSLQNRETCCSIWIRWADEDTWYPLDLDDNNMRVMRAAGNAVVKLTCGVSSGENGDLLSTESATVELKIRFPDFNSIRSNRKVRSAVEATWNRTQAAATATGRVEKGFWIRLDTSTGSYATTSEITSPVFGPKERGSVNLGDVPADNPQNPTPVGSSVYTVASFHAHSAMKYRVGTRRAGPSGQDHIQDTEDGVPGLVADYIPVSIPDKPWLDGPRVPGGHPIESAWRIYHSGPDRRSTPH